MSSLLHTYQSLSLLSELLLSSFPSSSVPRLFGPYFQLLRLEVFAPFWPALSRLPFLHFCPTLLLIPHSQCFTELDLLHLISLLYCLVLPLPISNPSSMYFPCLSMFICIINILLLLLLIINAELKEIITGKELGLSISHQPLFPLVFILLLLCL